MTGRVGKYELIRKLATGGMAEVFLARFEWARGLEKTVVIKRILYHLAEDPTFVEMFFTEAQVAAQLSHPNIAQIIEFGESDGAYFLAMEYVDGPSLRALEAAAHAGATGIPFAHGARIATFCCEALHYAHQLTDEATGQPLNLVHRDVSPDNILISKAGSVKLVDFGIAKATTQRHRTKTGLVKGKVAYMAPEQIQGDPLDRRADVFALGVVLYEMISGGKPFEAPSEVKLIHAMLYEDKIPLRRRRPDVPADLERIIDKAMARDLDQRYPDCSAMHADLEEYLIAARQSVSAIQLAELVARHRVEPDRGSGPHLSVATPSRSVAPPRTPEPWRAERTPTHEATAQLRQPRLRTGTDGEGAGAPPDLDAPAPVPATARTEVMPAQGAPPAATAPRPPEVEEDAPPPARQPERAREKAAPARPPSRPARSRTWMAPAAAGALVVAGVAFFRPWSPSPQPLPAETRSQAAESADAGMAHAAAGPVQPVQPDHPAKVAPPPPAPTIDLVLRSEPPGTLKVSQGGTMRARQESPLTAHVRPGVVDVEVSGSAGGQRFFRREKLTLDPDAAQVKRTIVVKQGLARIYSSPPAHVTIDGALEGDIPWQVPLYEGTHVLKFECDHAKPQCAGLQDATQTITVHAGETIPVRQHW